MKKIEQKTRQRWVTWLSFAVILLAVLLLGIGFPVCRDRAYICENTGSHKGHRQWFFGVRTGHWYRETHLEAFMREEHPSEMTNRWTSYAGTGKNMFGRSVLYGHGRPGAILNVSEEALNRYIDSLAPEGRVQLYRLLASDDQKKIEEAVPGIWEKAIELKWGTQPTSAGDVANRAAPEK